MRGEFEFERYNLNGYLINSQATLQENNSRILLYSLNNDYCLYENILISKDTFQIFLKSKAGFFWVREENFLYDIEHASSNNSVPIFHVYSFLQKFAKGLLDEDKEYLPKKLKENLERIINDENYQLLRNKNKNLVNLYN